MRKRIVWASIAVAAAAVLLLLVQREVKPETYQNNDKTPDVSGASRMRAPVVKTVRDDGVIPSGLAAAYAPGVVVITNGVLEPDPRHNFDPRPGMEDYEGWERYRKEMRETAKHGEKGKATFHVVDTDGNSVAGADISARFFGDSGARGQTDADGLFTVEGRTLNGASLSYTVNKQGFYQTRATYQLGKRGYRCLENGRWIPWNPTLRVTLKAIRKPIPMHMKRAKIILPAKDMDFEYDFLAGDLVEPYGKGKTADIALRFRFDRPRSPDFADFRQELEVKAVREGDGFLLKKKDEWSELASVAEAPLSGYIPSINPYYDRTATEIFRQFDVTANDYVIFRSRTTSATDGSTVSNYGKIYGNIAYGILENDAKEGVVMFRYYYNPTPNDRSLEFDGKNNLLEPGSSDLSWPK